MVSMDSNAKMKPPKRPRAMSAVSSKPGDNEKDKKMSAAYRENTERMTISVPRGLPNLLKSICVDLDLEYSKAFRRGIDLFVEENKNEINPRLYASYQAFRRPSENWE
jgi:hypothetical protein